MGRVIDLLEQLGLASERIAHAYASLAPDERWPVIGLAALVLALVLFAIVSSQVRAVRGVRVFEVLGQERSIARAEPRLPADPADPVAMAQPEPKPMPPQVSAQPAEPIKTRQKSDSQILIKALRPATPDTVERELGQQLMQRLELVLHKLAPGIAVRHGISEALGLPSARIPSFELGGSVHHMGDRVRIDVEMVNARTRAQVFRLRYICLPSKQEIILAEITSRILQATHNSVGHAA